MKPKAVARGVWQVGLRGVNVFLIEAGDGLVLVDAGLRHSPPRITEAIYSLGRLPQDVVAIVVTHTHRDHVGGLAEMMRRTGAEVWMHPADAALVRDGLYGRPFPHGPGRIFSLWPAQPGETGGPRVRGGLLRARPDDPPRGEQRLPRARETPRAHQRGDSGGRRRLSRAGVRHTHATQLLKAGVHPKVVSERLGHASIGITLDTYSHVMPGMQEEAAKKIDAGLSAALAG